MALFQGLESMTMDMMPMSADEDLPEECLFESCMELHEDHPHMMDCQNMCDTIDDLAHLHGVVEQFGVSKKMMAFANRDGILSAVMPAFAACEAMESDAEAGSPEADHAKASVVDKIKEVSAAWFHKAWSIVSGWGNKIMAFAKAGYEKAEMAAKWFAGKTMDAAHAVKENISAHPVAWVVGAATAAAAVASVIVGLWTGTLPTDAETYKNWMTHAQTSISEAFKKAGTTISEGAKDAVGHAGDAAHTAYTAVKTGTADALGYTKDGFNHMVESIKGLYSEGGAIHKLGVFFKGGAEKAFDAVKEHGGAGVAYARRAIGWLMKETGHLWSKAPATAMKYFTKALSVFKSLFSKPALAAPAVHSRT